LCGVTHCCGYSKIKNVIINCSSAWRISNKPSVKCRTHELFVALPSKHTTDVTRRTAAVPKDTLGRFRTTLQHCLLSRKPSIFPCVNKLETTDTQSKTSHLESANSRGITADTSSRSLRNTQIKQNTTNAVACTVSHKENYVQSGPSSRATGGEKVKHVQCRPQYSRDTQVRTSRHSKPCLSGICNGL
jgi:hypothetical protein